MKIFASFLLCAFSFQQGNCQVVDFQPPELISSDGKLDVTLDIGLVESLQGITWSESGFRIAPGYNGGSIGPTLRVKPGDVITVNLNNNLETSSTLDRELATYVMDPNSDDANTTIIYNRPDSIGNFYNPTYGFWGLNFNNLHFHGMDFSSKVEDLDNFIDGGESKTYVLEVPENKEPGLYWYHNHIHSTSTHSYLSSLFGMVIVEGTDNDITKATGVQGAKEINMALSEGLVNPDGTVPPFFPFAFQHNWTGVTNGNIGEDTIFNVVQGEPVLFRVVSVTVENFLLLSIPGVQFVVLAYDGFPLDVPIETDVVEIPAGGRAEFLARFDTPGEFVMSRLPLGLAPTAEACLQAFGIDAYPCVSFDIGTEVATFVVEEAVGYTAPNATIVDTVQLPEISDRLKALAEKEPVDSKTITMRQKSGYPIFQIPYDGPFVPPGVGFGIDDRLATPTVLSGTVKAGSCETWTVVSDPPGAKHAFHAHLANFMVTAIDGVEVDFPSWYDTFEIPFANVTMHICFDRAEEGDKILVHCHAAVHFDVGMGTFFEAVAGDTDESPTRSPTKGKENEETSGSSGLFWFGAIISGLVSLMVSF